MSGCQTWGFIQVSVLTTPRCPHIQPHPSPQPASSTGSHCVYTMHAAGHVLVMFPGERHPWRGCTALPSGKGIVAALDISLSAFYRSKLEFTALWKEARASRASMAFNIKGRTGKQLHERKRLVKIEKKFQVEMSKGMVQLFHA